METVVNSHLRELLEQIDALSPAELDVISEWATRLSIERGKRARKWRIQTRVSKGVSDDLERIANEHKVSRSMLLRIALDKVLDDRGQIQPYDRHGDCATCTVVMRVDGQDRHRIWLRAKRDDCTVSDVLRAAISRAISDSYLVEFESSSDGRRYKTYWFWRERYASELRD